MKGLKRFALAFGLSVCLGGLLLLSGIFDKGIHLLVFVAGCTAISLLYGEVIDRPRPFIS